MLASFFVAPNVITAQIYIRSSDFFLANNWNVCTGEFLVNIICNLEGVNLTPGKIICITGDTHVYKNHIEQAHQNLESSPRPFPKIVIKEKKKTIEEFQWEDMCLVVMTHCLILRLKCPLILFYYSLFAYDL